MPTKNGYPSWETVKSRYWKNEASLYPDRYTKSQLEMMKKGSAPLHPKYNVPMELHHVNGRKIPNPHNIKNLKPYWPWDHAKIDPFRYYKGPKP